MTPLAHTSGGSTGFSGSALSAFLLRFSHASMTAGVILTLRSVEDFFISISLSGGNDMDDFGVAIAAVHVNHYGKRELFQHPDGCVPLFVCHRVVFHRDVKWIGEYFFRLVERYAVLAQVRRCLSRVPREYRYHLFIIVYTTTNIVYRCVAKAGVNGPAR